MGKFISGWYHPSTVMFVDDNPNFLESLVLGLNTTIMAPKLFSNPIAAKKFLTINNKSEGGDNKLDFLSIESQGSGKQSINVDLSRIHQQIYNISRFSSIAVIVIDYAMPQLNGLDLAKEIRSLNSLCKILMLTGEADDKLAIEAFNTGIIHQFIRKKTGNDNTFQNSLNDCIFALQASYFNDLSKRVIDDLTKEREDSQNFYLNDPDFIKVFHQLCQKNNIVEYYILDTDGSFLFIDFQGNPQLLIVKSEESMEDTYQIALGADKPFPKEILDGLKDRKQLLATYEQNICDDYEEAKEFLQSATAFKGKSTCYYSLVSDLSPYRLNQKKILSFKDYIDKLDITIQNQ